jgi:hypothetical protein
LWFKANGIDRLLDETHDPERSFILIRIMPTPGTLSAYTAGHVLMNVEELEDTFERTLATDSFRHGNYHWPNPPPEMGQFFFAD